MIPEELVNVNLMPKSNPAILSRSGRKHRQLLAEKGP